MDKTTDPNGCSGCPKSGRSKSEKWGIHFFGKKLDHFQKKYKTVKLSSDFRHKNVSENHTGIRCPKSKLIQISDTRSIFKPRKAILNKL